MNSMGTLATDKLLGNAAPACFIAFAPSEFTFSVELADEMPFVKVTIIFMPAVRAATPQSTTLAAVAAAVEQVPEYTILFAIVCVLVLLI